MTSRSVSLFALALLAACEPIRVRPIEDTPTPPADEAELRAGSYVVTIEDVAAIVCDGVPPRAFVGQQTGAELRVGDEEVVFTVDGWELRGDMIPGAIFVEGSETVYYDVGPVTEDAPGDEDGGDSPPHEGCGDAPRGSEEAGAPDGSAEERTDGIECPDDGRDEWSSTTFVAIDAQILDGEYAEGRMTLLTDGCAVELVVSLAAGELDETEIERPDDEEREGGGEPEPVAG